MGVCRDRLKNRIVSPRDKKRRLRHSETRVRNADPFYERRLRNEGVLCTKTEAESMSLMETD